MKKENSLAPFFNEKFTEAGCDEAGRGCFVGPVVAAAVILPKDFYHPLLNDSKQLTDKKRDLLRPVIEQEAISWSVAFIDHEVIDKMNILNASIYGMHQAVDQLTVTPDFLLIDGNKFHTHTIPHQCFVKGDARFCSIAAASILAKTHRDEFMKNLHEKHPEYEWNKNMGYPTPRHKELIGQYGMSPYQRKTFTVRSPQLKLNI